MRTLLASLSLAFVLGSFSAAVQAHCSAHGKKNDFETPPIVMPSETKEDTKG